jgi:hypothetical protein
MSTSYTVGVKIEGSAAGLAKAAKEAIAHTKLMGEGMGKEFNKMARAREVLGVRPEREIQREIYKTEAAYSRLARSGALSFNEQRRAAKAMREEVARLTNEMGKLTTKQKLMRGAVIGGGVVAAGAMVAPTVRKTMAYDLRLAHLANTGYADSDKAGRIAGRNELDAKVSGAVKYGGGTRDSALDTLELLLGAGVFKSSQIDPLLRESVKAATANNADPASFAQMAIAANQSMGIAPEKMGRMFGMATFTGQSGGFEIKDMAKWLSQQMAAAKAVGMSGEQGFAKLAALNQAAVVTAGTKDEAGNNVVNLLAKMGSQDTAKDFKKMGINLPKQLAEGRMKGLDALDVVGNLLQDQLGKDKNFQQVQRELAAAKNDAERAEKLKAVGDIAQGTVIGNVFKDRQALMALYGYMNARERVNKMAKDAPANADAVDRNFDVISDTASFKADQTLSARDMAFQKTLDKMMPAIGGVADGLTSLMTQYPIYTTAIVGAATALTGLAGAAGLAALAQRGGAGIPGLPGGARGAGSGSTAAGASRFAGFATAARTMLGPLMLLEALTQPSEKDIATLRRMDAEEAAKKAGHRGKGVNDPRLIGSGFSATDVETSLRASEVKGEIFVRVIAAPGLQIETSATSSNPRIPMKTALGQTNMGAGY